MVYFSPATEVAEGKTSVLLWQCQVFVITMKQTDLT